MVLRYRGKVAWGVWGCLFFIAIAAGAGRAAQSSQDPSRRAEEYRWKTFIDTVAGPFEALGDLMGIVSLDIPVKTITGKILFDSNRSGRSDIYLYDSGSLTLLCKNGVDPRWSPDGASFICRPAGENATWNMAIVDVAGRLVRVLKPFEHATVYSAVIAKHNPHWVYFYGRKDPYSKPALYLMDLASGAITTVCERAMGSFDLSPDGTTIVFTAPEDENARVSPDCLWTMTISGKEAKAVEGTHSAASPVFSPDGSLIAYTAPSEPDGIVQIFIYNTTTGRIRMLTSSAYPKARPVWSPDGTMLCYQAFVHKADPYASEIFVLVNLEKPEVARMMKPARRAAGQWASDRNPSWAPR